MSTPGSVGNDGSKVRNTESGIAAAMGNAKRDCTVKRRRRRASRSTRTGSPRLMTASKITVVKAVNHEAAKEPFVPGQRPGPARVIAGEPRPHCGTAGRVKVPLDVAGSAMRQTLAAPVANKRGRPVEGCGSRRNVLPKPCPRVRFDRPKPHARLLRRSPTVGLTTTVAVSPRDGGSTSRPCHGGSGRDHSSLQVA